MSQAVISYSKLEDAASEADKVATRLDTYSDEIYSKIYSKLTSYSGTWVEGLSDAKSNAIAKRNELAEKADHYRSYADDLRQLENTCQQVDNAVKQNISQLSSSFQTQNNISVGVLDYVGMYISNALNDSAVGRWINQGLDAVGESFSELGDSIKNWYNFGGGEQLVDLVGTAILGVALCVFTVLAITASAPFVVIAAAVVSAAILLVNTCVDIAGEVVAYMQVSNGDPVAAYRSEAIDSAQDLLRESDSSAAHIFATILDVTSFVCGAITMVYGVSNLIKSGYKWATATTGDVTGVSYGEMLKTIGTKVKTSFTTTVTDIKVAFSVGDWAFFKTGAIDFGKDFLTVLKTTFWNFNANTGNADLDAALYVKSGKALTGLFQDLFTGDGSGLFFTFLGTIPLVNVPTTSTTNPKYITVGNLVDTVRKPISTLDSFFDFFSNDSPIDSSSYAGINALL